jgi:hypothetical protein
MGRLGDEGRPHTIVVIGIDGGLVPTLAPNSRGQKNGVAQQDKIGCRFGHGPLKYDLTLAGSTLKHIRKS